MRKSTIVYSGKCWVLHPQLSPLHIINSWTQEMKKKLNGKLEEASTLLMKDKKKGKTYGSNMAGPQVEGMALDGSEVIDLWNHQ